MKSYLDSTITKGDVKSNKKLLVKMLKMALLNCAINEKCCSVDGGRGICPLFSSHPGGFDIQGKNAGAGAGMGGTRCNWN